MNYELEQIPLLIAKQLVGTISDEERLQLEAWRKQSTFNEETFQRLMDRKRLTIEQERHALTDYERPLTEMKRQLRPRTFRRWMAAAAVTLLIIGGAGLLWINRHANPTEHMVAQAEIRPGHTMATLTRANGETVELTETLENNTHGTDEAADNSLASHHSPLKRPLPSRHPVAVNSRSYWRTARKSG